MFWDVDLIALSQLVLRSLIQLVIFPWLLLLLKMRLQFCLCHLWEGADCVQVKAFVDVADPCLDGKQLFVIHVIEVELPPIEADLMLALVGDIVFVKTHVIELKHAFATDCRAGKTDHLTTADSRVSDRLDAHRPD